MLHHVFICLLSLFPILAFAATATGYAAKRQTSGATISALENRRAGIGLWLGGPPLLVALLALGSDYLSQCGHLPSRLAACRGSVSTIEFAMERYASRDGQQFYPELSAKPGRLSIQNCDTRGVCFIPQYLSCREVLACPQGTWPDVLLEEDGLPKIDDCLENSSYIYLGYAIHDESEMQTFAAAYKKRMDEGLAFNADLIAPAADGKGAKVICRLRGEKRKASTGEGESKHPPESHFEGRPEVLHQGETTHYTAEERSRIPVLIERLGHHRPNGGNVLYLDGTMEYLRYPGSWPMTEKTMAILRDMEAYRPQREESKTP